MNYEEFLWIMEEINPKDFNDEDEYINYILDLDEYYKLDNDAQNYCYNQLKTNFNKYE